MTSASPFTALFHVDNMPNSNAKLTVHVFVVYSGNNGLSFRCPACGAVHTHGAGGKGGASNGTTCLPHCYCDTPNFLEGAGFQFSLCELTERFDPALAGDLGPLAGRVCPRRWAEPGYDQLGHGQLAPEQDQERLITDYRPQGGHSYA